jgi:hypothetical protein
LQNLNSNLATFQLQVGRKITDDHHLAIATMSDILSLPNEMILNIFSLACPTAEDAARIAKSHRKLRAIWLEHGHIILKDILGDAWNDAFDLAVYESRLLAGQDFTDTVLSGQRTPLSFCLPRLLHTARLADSLKVDCLAWAKTFFLYNHDRTHPERSRWVDNTTILNDISPASYYLARLLVLARRHHVLREKLYAKVKTTPRERLNKDQELVSWFLYGAQCPDDIRIRHGSYDIPVENTVDRRSKLKPDINYHGWKFAYAVVHAQLWKPELLEGDCGSLEDYCDGLRVGTHFEDLILA